MGGRRPTRVSKDPGHCSFGRTILQGRHPNAELNTQNSGRHVRAQVPRVCRRAVSVSRPLDKTHGDIADGSIGDASSHRSSKYERGGVPPHAHSRREPRMEGDD